MGERRLRKRFPVGNRNRLEGVEDELAFVRNRSSLNARKIISIKPNLIIELWFDKHYYDRFQLGDDNGMREGIDPITVESLVTRSMEHLFFYSTVLKGFKFVNHEDNGDFGIRVILQEPVNGSKLNVVIEVHYLEINRFEVTVITALVSDSFRMIYGQFCIEIQQEHSFLRKFDNGKVFEICSL